MRWRGAAQLKCFKCLCLKHRGQLAPAAGRVGVRRVRVGEGERVTPGEAPPTEKRTGGGGTRGVGGRAEDGTVLDEAVRDEGQTKSSQTDHAKVTCWSSQAPPPLKTCLPSVKHHPTVYCTCFIQLHPAWSQFTDMKQHKERHQSTGREPAHR